MENVNDSFRIYAVLRRAQISGLSKDEELRRFLKGYRETPHSTTKVAPFILMMGHSNSTGIVGIPFNANKIKSSHNEAKRNVESAKQKMKEECDVRMRAQEHHIEMGSEVLIKLKKINKSTPAWDPRPLIVIAIKGSTITAAGKDLVTTKTVRRSKR